MNKNIVLAGFATSIVAASLTSSLAASAATNSSAATIKATTSCGKIKVDLTGFSSFRTNSTVTATLDGTKVIDHRFTSTYSFVFYADSASAHTIQVRATNRDGRPLTKSITTSICTSV
jgi:hypothetical protein